MKITDLTHEQIKNLRRLDLDEAVYMAIYETSEMKKLKIEIFGHDNDGFEHAMSRIKLLRFGNMKLYHNNLDNILSLLNNNKLTWYFIHKNGTLILRFYHADGPLILSSQHNIDDYNSITEAYASLACKAFVLAVLTNRDFAR